MTETHLTENHLTGVQRLPVGSVGLGAMPLSVEGRPDERQAVATVHAALDAGVRLIDTADCYQWHADELGHNERLVARALAAYGGDAADVLVATKGGRGRPGDGSWTVDGRPEHLRRAAEESAARLGVAAIGLYQLHKPDPRVPFAESVGALRELADAGTIRLVGLSNVDRAQILTARQILGERLVSVQNRFSPAHQETRDTLDLCTSLGLAFLPWSPLGGISVSAVDDPGSAPGPDGAFHAVARERGVSPQQVCLAWHLAQSPVVLPIPGARRPASIRDSAAATGLRLTARELALLGPADLAADGA
ncbi:aldo/keto reductase [Kitasatospora viridis]|uniref:Aryl-alcohol dehydrogenase-like predicted oxidoreductase n=1 Tax=Kitasatospora viridis TaxID=281105 RepID=A0A561SDP8_9ACTN|nr:aldo/keto reductase [Kitasatospora viridis]TWF72968.1 aryl-alcohol dehydrogenase-like predicted oxidoreductase [Kitasatospora viridis]